MSGDGSASRGVIGLVASACTSCMLCVRECPTWCITLDSHTEDVSEPGAISRPGARPRKVNVLDDFSIDFGLCMYCGICVDVCPFDALEWNSAFDYSADSRAGLVQAKTRLGEWTASEQVRPQR